MVTVEPLRSCAVLPFTTLPSTFDPAALESAQHRPQVRSAAALHGSSSLRPKVNMVAVCWRKSLCLACE